jgi:hypothetical protein
MPTDSHSRREVLAFAILLVTAFSSPVAAAAEGGSRIRSDSALLTNVFTSAHQRSSTFRSLVEHIERSDVIVHLTCSRFTSDTLAGQTLLGAVVPGVRYVRVQVSCRLSEPALVMIVAHELQHVVEIALTPSVVDGKSFARLFSAIGFSTCWSPGSERFETKSAIAAGERARSQYLRYSESSVQASAVDRRGEIDVQPTSLR